MISKLTIAGSICILGLPLSMKAQNKDPEHPNIIFFLTEDLSPQFLQMYNPDQYGGKTPNVEKLYNEGGLLFTRAYSNASVSSAARTTLITGCYAPRFDGAFHRKFEELPLPEGLKMFPTYLREAGYFTANAKKKDYNVQENQGTWDIGEGNLGDWEKRKDKSQPFFFQRSNMLTHESKIQFSEHTYNTIKTKTDPQKTNIPSYLPNTKLMRYTFAKEYDNIAASDAEFGEMIKMLEKDGELDNTFIFYFGDNGGTLPGTKGYTNDIGYHVPLMVYIPKTWRNKINLKLPSHQDGKVTFMDFGPTALNLAGIKEPKEMDGIPFLGPNTKPGQDIAYCYGDRYDEFYSFNRCLYKGDFRYARNYQPFHSRSMYAEYRYQLLAFMQWRDMYKDGKLNERQSRFFKPQGPEELYNISTDPNEMHNLATDPKYKSVLLNMRQELTEYLGEKADLGFYPETITYEEGFKNPDTWGNKNRNTIKALIKIADMQLQPLDQNYDALKEILNNNNYVKTWWALNDIASFGKEAINLKPFVIMCLDNARSFNRTAALVALSSMGVKIPSSQIYPILKDCKTDQESLLCLNDIVYMLETGSLEPFTLDFNQVPKHTNFAIDWRIDYINQIYWKGVRHFNGDK